MKFLLGIVCGAIVTVLVGVLALPKIGVFDMTATGQPGLLDWWGGTNLDSVLAKKAAKATVPASASADQGLAHYAAVCVHCHGAPETRREDWAGRMLPLPPNLWQPDTQEMSDGEIYYVIDKGIRMSGMPAFGPAHSKTELWNLVALVRGLDKVSKTLKEQLSPGGGWGYQREENDRPPAQPHQAPTQ